MAEDVSEFGQFLSAKLNQIEPLDWDVLSAENRKQIEKLKKFARVSALNYLCCIWKVPYNTSNYFFTDEQLTEIEWIFPIFNLIHSRIFILSLLTNLMILSVDFKLFYSRRIRTFCSIKLQPNPEFTLFGRRNNSIKIKDKICY